MSPRHRAREADTMIRLDRTRRARKDGGFTLLEVLIAITILGVGIVAIMQLFPLSMRQTRVAAERTAAVQVAGSELARLRALSTSDRFREWVADQTQRSLAAANSTCGLYCRSGSFSSTTRS